MSAHNIRNELEKQRERGGAAAVPSGSPPAANGNGNGEPASAGDAALLRQVGVCGFTHAQAGRFLGRLDWRPGPDGGRFLAVDSEGRERRVEGGNRDWEFFGGPAAVEVCRAAKWPEKRIGSVDFAGAGGAPRVRAIAEASAETAAPALASEDSEVLCLAEALLVA